MATTLYELTGQAMDDTERGLAKDTNSFLFPPRVKTNGTCRVDVKQRGEGVFDAVPFTPTQGVCTPSPRSAATLHDAPLFSAFGSAPVSSGFHGSLDIGLTGLRVNNSGGSSDSSTHGQRGSSSGGGAASSMPQYSPFMLYPSGPPIPGYRQSDTQPGSPNGMPSSPMSPGVVLHPSPFGGHSSHTAVPMPAPPSPRTSFYSAAFAGIDTGPPPRGPYNSLSLRGQEAFGASMHAGHVAGGPLAPHASLPDRSPYDARDRTPHAYNPPLYSSPSLPMPPAQHPGGQLQHPHAQPPPAQPRGMASQQRPTAFANPYTQAGFLQTYGHAGMPVPPQLSALGAGASAVAMEAQLSAPPSLHQRHSHGGVSALHAQQLQACAPQPQHSLQTAFSGVSLTGFGSSSAAAAAAAAAAANMQQHQQPHPQVPPHPGSGGGASRLRMAHSADLSALDAGLGQLQQRNSVSAGGPRFKPRKNSEPKVGPDGQLRLNARQRRTLRRAKERALKGLLEISQALLVKADVDVQLPPNLSSIAANLVEEADVATDLAAEAAAAGGAAQGDASCAEAKAEKLRSAAAGVEDAAASFAAAAVAAVAAKAAGRDTRGAAAAAQAAADAAATAAATAGCGADVTDVSARLSRSSISPTDSTDSHGAAGSSVGSASGAVLSPKGAAASRAPAASPRVRSGAAAPAPTSEASSLEAIDIGSLIRQLAVKQDEGMVDDKLIRDLQIIQSLIGALNAPVPGASGTQPGVSSGSGHHHHHHHGGGHHHGRSSYSGGGDGRGKAGPHRRGASYNAAHQGHLMSAHSLPSF